MPRLRRLVRCTLLTVVVLLGTGCSGDPAPAAKTAADGTGGDAVVCQGLPSCLNGAGQEDLSLCPQPVSQYACVQGCCQAKTICQSDADCAGQNGVALGCSDLRFTCGCDDDSGQCVQTMCSRDDQCGKDKEGKALICSQGGCIPPPADAGLQVRLLRPLWIAEAGAQLDAAVGLGAQAADAKGHVQPKAALTWNLAASPAFTLQGGVLQATQTAGKATITAQVTGSNQPPSQPATLWNLGPLPAGKNLRVTAIDEDSGQPVGGKVVVVGLADAPTPAAALTADLVDGQAALAGVQFPADVHLVAKDHATVSVLRYDPAGKPADLLLPTALRHYADLELDDQGKVVSAKSKLQGGDAVRGEISYPGSGEAELGITAQAFGPQLLTFSIDSILGSNVRRPFSPDAPAIVAGEPGKPQEIPGGVTFSLGKPVVTQYVVTAPPGRHTLWTLAGRLSLTDVITEVTQIVDAVDGGLQIGRVVSVLLPYLSGFSSAVQQDVEFGSQLAEPLRDLGKLAPDFPLLLRTAVQLAPLPQANGGWADLVFVIGGALMPSGEIVPLGLTAGADVAGEADKADGVVDGDSTEPGNQPLRLAVGPLHSRLQVGTANHVLVTAAVALAGKGRKEGGSIAIGLPGPIAAETAAVPLLPLPLGSAFDPQAGTLQVAAVEGAHAYRVTLLASEGRQWQLIVPKGAVGKTLQLADLSAYGAALQVAEAKRALVGAVELRKPLDVRALVAPGGLEDLLRQVSRTSFTDAAP